MSSELIVNFTPTGMVPTKGLTTYVPITVNEIVEDVLRAAELGITLVHLHARNEDDGLPSYRREIYGRIIEGIRTYHPELVICVSLSGRNFNELEKRSDALFLEGNLKPDMGSLTLSSLNFVKSASVNSPEMVMNLANLMTERGIVPELEVFDLGMINYAKYLIKKRLLTPPFYFNLLFGNISSAQPNLLHIASLLNDLPEDSLWSLAGLGSSQFKINTLSMAIGGGVRVGIEDNIWYDDNKTQLASNHALLQRIHNIVNAMEGKVMTSKQFRDKMQMEPGNGHYGRINKSVATVY